MVKSLLKIEEVVKNFGGLCAVAGANLNIERGKFVGLVGPNGCGKTTLLNTVYGLHKADAGHVYFANEDITRFTPHKVFSRGMVYAFQFPRLFPTLSVLDNMIIASRRHPGDMLFNSVLRRPKWQKEEERIALKAMELLEMMLLSHLTFSPAGQLSGGQQKLLEIGRALMTEPELLLLDEPAAGINPVLAKQIFETLEKSRQGGLSFLVIEHRLELLIEYAQYVYVMDKGKIVLEGEPSKVMNDSVFFDVYAGG